MKTQHMEAPAPAAPRCGGRWGLYVPCFHMYEAPPGALGRPRKPRFKAEARLSNIAYPGAPSKTPGYPGVPRGTRWYHVLPRVLRDTPGHPWVLRATPG
jgi:hypothetical protein